MAKRNAYSFDTPRTVRKLELILAALTEKPMTRQELATKIHASKASVCDYIEHLKKARKIRISRYVKGEGARGRHSPVYAIGAMRDAKEPPRKTRAEHFADQKANALEYEFYRSKKAVQARIRRTRTQAPATWLSALTGA